MLKILSRQPLRLHSKSLPETLQSRVQVCDSQAIWLKSFVQNYVGKSSAL